MATGIEANAVGLIVGKATPIQEGCKKVAIVGCAETKAQAPFNDHSWELWGVNNLFGHIPRWTRWFEIHSLKYDETKKRWMRRMNPDLKKGTYEWSENFRGQPVNDYIMGLQTMECPVYMQKAWPQIPGSKPYPLKEVLDRFPRQYFTNTISWMIALAIYEGFEEINVYGVDMAVDCLSPDTKVLTADLQWVPSGNVKIGDALMAFDEYPGDGEGKTRRWRKTIVTKAREVMRPCYELGLDDGTCFVASEKHGWLTHGGNINRWKTTDELMTRHHRTNRPTRILKMVEPWKEDHSWEAGYLAASFDGEGSICQQPRKGMQGIYTNSMSYSQRENEMKRTVLKLMDHYGFKHNVTSVNKSDTDQINIQGGKPEIMRFLGQIRPHRLLPKFKPKAMGEFQSMKNVAVIECRPVGPRPVMGIETDAKTFIAEGFASHNSEYHYQRPSCEYFLGMAEGMGIKVHIPDEADLLKTRFLYGFGETEKAKWDKKIQQMMASMEQRKANAEQQHRLAETQINQYIGALMAVKEVNKIWG